MKINTNIGLKNRSKVTLSNFRGLDTLSSVVDVSAIHSTDMQNLISRDGVNHKRYGWKTRARLRHDSKWLKIQGIFSFTIFLNKFLIVYAGKKFWLVNEGDMSYVDITQKSIKIENGIKQIFDREEEIASVNEEDLEERECKYFINGNKVYFVGCGDFLVFSRWKNNNFELRRVVNNEDAYIPTTTENISWNGIVTYKEVNGDETSIVEQSGNILPRVTAEEQNLLSPYSYNTLFGVEKLNENDSVSYYLDTKGFTDIEVSIQNKGGEIYNLVLDKSMADDKVIDEPLMFVDLNTEEVTEENTIQGVLEEQTETDYTRRWFTYKDACNAGVVGIYYDIGSERKRAEESINPNTGEKFGTYQAYLDYQFEKHLGKAPDLNYTGEKISNYYVTIGVPSSFDVATMNNGDKLFLRNEVKEYSDFFSEGNNIYIKQPTKISYNLVYVQSNGGEHIVKTVVEKNISCKISRASEGSVDVSLSFNYGNFTVDLVNYNVTSIILSEKFKETEVSCLSGQILKPKEETDTKVEGLFSILDGKLVLKGVKDKPEIYAPLVPDVPNIKVKITRNIDETIIIKSFKACEFGTQGTPDRLFLVDASGNIVRWSKDNDFTYFGHKSWCVCGTADKRITGMDRLNDSTLLLVKEYSPLEPSIFVISGSLGTSLTEADTTDYQAIFSPKGFQVGMGAVGNIVNFNGDCLMVANDGLYAVVLGENMTVDSRYILHRSRQISNTLEKFDLSKAKCISYNGKFFISVGGECYIADNKYTASFKGDMQNVVNYEWWRWTNIPVNVWGVVDNELWFGTENGLLCSFTKDFYDETITPLKSGVISYVTNAGGEIIGFRPIESILISEDDIFTFTCEFYGQITTNKFSVEGNEVRFNLPLSLFEDKEKIYINNEPYEISKKLLYCSIEVEDIESIVKDDTITFYKNYNRQHLSVDIDIDDKGTYFVLKDKEGKNIIWSPVKNKGVNPSITIFENKFFGTISHKDNVVASWTSGAMDLGTRSYSKTLTSIVLTGEKDLANRLKYSLITRTSKWNYEHLRANNGFDFGQLDLETLSLDSEFASSYSKRLNVRDANFIVLYLESDTYEDLAINSVQIEFKICKRNIGVK